MARRGSRTIRKAALNALLGAHRGVARALAGPGASKKQIETKRRLVLKHISEGDDGVESMTDAMAAQYEELLGVSRDEFLEPADDPREAELRRLEERAERLRAELRDEQ